VLAVGSRLRSLLGRLPRVESPAWLIVVLVLAGILRLLRIGASSLWADEAFSWLVARRSAWAILTQRLEPILPPLYHLLLHFWIQLGESEAVLRGFSALCGLLAIPVIYALGRELFTPAAGLAAALLMAVLPFQVYFAQETRLYALVVLLSALLLWGFVHACKKVSWWCWGVLGFLSALNLYAHYFTAFTLIVFHAFVLLKWPRDRRYWWGMLLADGVALALWGPHVPSVLAQTQQVATNFWLTTPSLLELVKTLVYLLFSHTTPVYLNPVALFVALSVVTLVAWAGIRARGEARQRALLLLALVLIPNLIALAVSWLAKPVYLDRSFSLVTPAYVLLLGWGLAHPPKGSPVRILYGGLAVLIVISLGNHYLNPDPAKPPFREVGAMVREGWKQGDVLFHLHDSTYLPLCYYAPEAESYLLNNDPETWLPSYTWDWAGQRVSTLDDATVGRERLWLVAADVQMSQELSERHRGIVEQATASYDCKEAGAWYGVRLTLCDLQEMDGE
jgi:mannosyltransferase